MPNVREIVRVGDNILREKAVPVRRFDGRLHRLLEDMALTMREAEGVGLAAPQVGIGKRVIVVADEGGVKEFVNPVITRSSGVLVGAEGCLSILNIQGMVPRFESIDVEALDRNGEPFSVSAHGYMARVLQHEIDHLEGKLFTDIMTEEIKD
ncbi:MAG: peptide deformylase [Clostridiales bacterium]|nr:peptide deformylase [Clostridiales bacterium]